MAVSIELWVDGRLTDGAEQWWDDVEIAVDASRLDLPLLDSINPYGELRLHPPMIRDLAREIEALLPSAPEAIKPFLRKLAGLCEQGSKHNGSELRFVGD